VERPIVDQNLPAATRHCGRCRSRQPLAFFAKPQGSGYFRTCQTCRAARGARGARATGMLEIL
jgi:hypothetical protein